MNVRTTPEADDHAREIDAWWHRNRPASPELFLDELAQAFSLLSHAPSIGHMYRASPVAGTRRLLLKGTRYHVYYVATDEEVRVLAIWHARRGVGPPLRLS